MMSLELVFNAWGQCRSVQEAIPCLHPLRMDPITLHFNIFQARMTARGVPGGMGRESPGAEFMLGNLVLCHSKFKDMCLNLTCDNAFTCFYRETCSIFPGFFSISIPGRRARKPASKPPTQQASHSQPQPASKQASLNEP